MITRATIPQTTSSNGFSAHHAHRAHSLTTRNSAADFQDVLNPHLTASRRTDSNTFLSLVSGANDPQSKRAAIDGFASGFASANIATPSQAASGAAAQDPVAVMNSYATLANQIAASDLPTSIKTDMLDDIAKQMAALYDQQKQSTNPAGASANASGGNSTVSSPRYTQPNFVTQTRDDTANASPEQMVAQFNQMSRHAHSHSARSVTPHRASTGSGSGSSSDTMAAVEQSLAQKGIPAYSSSDSDLPDYVQQQLEAARNSGTNTSGDSSGASDQRQSIWSHEVKDGVGMIHLGDEYTLRIDEKDQSITLVNNQTHASTRIWGDPHMDIGNDGKNDVDFHDGMTLKLDNGLELRLGTMSNGGDVTYTTNLTILQGDRAIQVSGIAGDMDGKDNLRIVQSNEGEALAHLTPKGAFVLHESGGTWETKEHQAVSQDYINEAEKLYHGGVHIMG